MHYSGASFRYSLVRGICWLRWWLKKLQTERVREREREKEKENKLAIFLFGACRFPPQCGLLTNLGSLQTSNRCHEFGHVRTISSSFFLVFLAFFLYPVKVERQTHGISVKFSHFDHLEETFLHEITKSVGKDRCSCNSQLQLHFFGRTYNEHAAIWSRRQPIYRTRTIHPPAESSDVPPELTKSFAHFHRTYLRITRSPFASFRHSIFK